MASSRYSQGSPKGDRRRGTQSAPRSGTIARIFALWMILALLTAQACALPIHPGFAFLRGDEKPVTEGCETKTCCTALCYVDKHGTHHCVHQTDHTCKSGVSTNEVKNNPILPLPAVTLPVKGELVPELIPIGWIPRTLVSIENCDLTTPSPPPK